MFKVYPCCNLKSFSLINNISLYWHTTLLFNLLMNILLFFHILAILNIHVQVCVWTYIFNSFGYIPRSGIALPYGNSMFNFLRTCQTVFHSVCIILLSYQQCTRVLIFSTSSPTLVVFHYFDKSHPNGCEVLCEIPLDHSTPQVQVFQIPKVCFAPWGSHEAPWLWEWSFQPTHFFLSMPSGLSSGLWQDAALVSAFCLRRVGPRSSTDFGKNAN